jgi:hypothetical protein
MRAADGRPPQRKANRVRYEPDTFQHHQPVDESAVTMLAESTLATPPVSEPDQRGLVAAAPDIPAAVGGMIAGTYATLIIALYVATAGSPSSIFAIVIAGFLVVAFFTVPRIFFAIEPMTATRPGLGRFMKRGMQTLTGHASGPAALVQMLVVPVFLTFAVLAMGLIAAFTA